VCRDHVETGLRNLVVTREGSVSIILLDCSQALYFLTHAKHKGGGGGEASEAIIYIFHLLSRHVSRFALASSSLAILTACSTIE